MFKAIKNNNIKKVKLFLDTYKDVVNAISIIEKTPFLFAAWRGQLAIAKLLKERGANIHATDNYVGNALHFACLFSGSVEMVTWLLDECKLGLESKTKPSSGFMNMFSSPFDLFKNGYEKTPFLCTAEKGQLAIAKLLKDRGANIHATDNFGGNALHAACYYSGSVEMVTWLLDTCKLDIESKGYKQITPFLFAAWRGQLAIAKLLKERGANIHAKDKHGENALQLTSNKEMISYLESLGLR